MGDVAEGIARQRLLASGSLAHAALAAGSVLPGLCLVQIANAFQLSDAQCGVLLAVAPAVSFATLPWFGLWAERQGKRALLAAGLTLLACGMALFGIADSYFILVLGAVCLGMASSVIDGLVSPLVLDIFPHRSAPVMNFVHCCFQIGIAVTAVGAGIYLAKEGLWQRTFWPVFLVAVGVAISFAATRFPPQLVHVKPLKLAGLLGSLQFWLCAVVIFMAGAVESGILVWVPTLLQRLDLSKLGHWLGEISGVRDPGPLLGGLGVALFAIPMVIGRGCYGALAERFGYRWILVLSCAVCTVGLAMLGLVNSAGSSIVSLAILGLALSGVWPTLLILAGTTINASKPTLFSLLAMAGLAGVSVANWGIGQIASRYGVQVGLASLIVPVIAAILALVGLGIWDRRG